MLRKNFPRRKEQRTKEASERQLVRSHISSEQQLRVLDERLGKDVGAVKERIKLNCLIGEK